MKKIYLLAVCSTVVASSAVAADLPSRKEVVVAPIVLPQWQGFYAGLNSGYGFGVTSSGKNQGWYASDGGIEEPGYGLANSYPLRGLDQGGFIGGGQVGYNYQWGENYVFGFEADMQGAGITGRGNANGWATVDGDASLVHVNNMPVRAGINWLGTGRARIGRLISPTVLLYGTGGIAFGGAYIDTFPSNYLLDNSYGSTQGLYPTTQNSQQSVLVGWTAGAGAEWMVSPNWSIKGEALYYNLGNLGVANQQYGDNYNTTAVVVGGTYTAAAYAGVIARVGVNYHFNLGSMPVVAKF